MELSEKLRADYLRDAALCGIGRFLGVEVDTECSEHRGGRPHKKEAFIDVLVGGTSFRLTVTL